MTVSVTELPNDDALGSYLSIVTNHTEIMFKDQNIDEVAVSVSMLDSHGGRSGVKTVRFILTRAAARHIADYLNNPQT